jgi:hypothetical protein
MAELLLSDLTEVSVTGEGVFDKLMQATRAHLDEEFKRNRIRGPEYSTVYVSGLQSAMDQSIRFLLERDNVALIQAQIALAEKQLLQADKDLELADKAIEKADKEIDLAQAQIDKMLFERDLTEQQVLNMQLEALNIPKQGALLDQQVLNAEQDVLLSAKQVEKLTADITLIPKQGALLDQQVLNAEQEVLLSEQQVVKIGAEVLNIPKQGELLDAQTAVQEQNAVNLACEETKCQKEILKLVEETLNVPKQGLVLVAQECKLKAEYDILVEQKAQVINNAALLAQKIITEQAQTVGLAADETSAIGRQNEVLRLQGEGFKRLAEQKAADIVADLLKVEMGVTSSAGTTDAIDEGGMKLYFNKLFEGVNSQ